MLDRASLTCSELLQAHSNRICMSDFGHVCLRGIFKYCGLCGGGGGRAQPFGIYNVLLLISNSFVVLLRLHLHPLGELRYLIS